MRERPVPAVEVERGQLPVALLAREAADQATADNPAKPRFVAGVLGPTNRTASISPDVNNPAFRAVNYDQLVETYFEQAKALVEGGADVLLVETVFDSLNSRAALFALESLCDSLGQRLPVMLSFTITDQSGRTLSGQTVEAYWNSVSNIELLSVGINCALGPKEMRPYIDELSRIAPVNVSSYPNAGLPNPLLPTGLVASSSASGCTTLCTSPNCTASWPLKKCAFIRMRRELDTPRRAMT